MARVHRLQHVECLDAAHLAEDDAVGPHAQRVAHEIALRDRAAPSIFAARVSIWTTCGCCNRSSTASSIVMMRSTGRSSAKWR